MASFLRFCLHHSPLILVVFVGSVFYATAYRRIDHRTKQQRKKTRSCSKVLLAKMRFHFLLAATPYSSVFV
ncbi:hypothetical protein PIB30_055521 [Stylosanthes scabra]|uniref:Secreted protein n=1 Tax=Stylosanthes scabra TaxID=79078 RepID=A0ABU6ZHU5_9FABA|nr:hypothetical protein [Stylosanthes scabra]